MKYGTIQSSQLSGPDNPHRRWDAAYNLLISRLKSGDDAVTQQEWADALTASKRRNPEVLGSITQADTALGIYAALVQGFDLDATAISPELHIGFLGLARRIALKRAAWQETEAIRLREAAHKLRESILP